MVSDLPPLALVHVRMAGHTQITVDFDVVQQTTTGQFAEAADAVSMTSDQSDGLVFLQ